MPTNVIIDGHGAELDDNFDFRRAANDASSLYSYVRQGIGIPINQSNNIIAGIQGGNLNAEIATINQSRIGGALLHDKLLSAIETVNGNPHWNNDGLFAAGVHTTISVAGVNMEQFALGNNIYLRLPVDSPNTVKLSDIIGFYNVGQYNFFWVVCRSE